MKEVTANIKNTFVEIGQYDVARYDKALQPSIIRGLYTTNLTTCVAIILRNRDNTRFLLAHIDTNVHTDSLVDHFAWFGQMEYCLHFCQGQAYSIDCGYTSMILSDPTYSAAGFVKRLENSLSARGIPKWREIYTYQSKSGVAGISIDGSIIIERQDNVVKYPWLEKNFSANMSRYLAKYYEPGMYALMRLYPVYESGYWYKYTDTTRDVEYAEYLSVLKKLGNQLVKRNKFLEGLGYYLQATKINPEVKELWFNIGFCFKNLASREDEAVEAFDRAVRIDPKYIKALWHKSELLIRQNLFKEAMVCIKLVLSIDPTNEDVLKLKERCFSCVPIKEEKDLEVEHLQLLVAKVQEQILTSNDIILRETCPYYFNSPLIPKALTNFKAKLVAYRSTSSEIITAMKEYPLEPDMLPFMGDFSMGSFSHFFVGSLVVSFFGIGECSECSAKVVVKMLKKGRGNFTFVAIKFTNAQANMEQTHQFIATNLDKNPEEGKGQTPLYTFFSNLPKNAIIIDAFLGLVFKPNNISREFTAYINAYGGSAVVINCWHLKNMGQRFLNHYLSVTDKIFRELCKPGSLIHEKNYSLDDKSVIEDTSLIHILKNKTHMNFFGVRDAAYKVDAVAVVEIHDKNTQATALSIQDTSMGYGKFFHDKTRGQIFVLEAINLSELPGIQAHIQSL